MNHRAVLRDLFQTAVATADPFKAVAKNLPQAPPGRTVVIAAGKASIPMAKALEDNWTGPLEGFAVAPHGYASPLLRIDTVHASHPVADQGSVLAAEKALALAATLGPQDLFIALISGGGSALLAKPAPGIALDEKLSVVRTLLKSGASIHELNCVRKQLSAIKGGRLARAAGGARIHTLIISDVPGDDPSVIASGPTVVDGSTKAEALAILQRYRVTPPTSVIKYLMSDSHFPATELRNDIRVIVSPRASFLAAQAQAEKTGLTTLYLSDRIEGEARDVAKVHAAIAQHVKQHDAPIHKPSVILSGGETSVTVRGKGRGGRNVEFALSLAIALAGEAGIYAIAADTDGVDGTEPVAGALITPDTLARARHLGIDPVQALENNDGHGFFEALGDQVVTGPTQTNVNDFRAILIA